MPKYVTYTIVVREDEDIIGEALDLCADGVMFLSAVPGVGEGAIALGAKPIEWASDELEELANDIADECLEVYDEGGQSAVYKHVHNKYPQLPWHYCPACEDKTPFTPDEGICLVCWSVYEPAAQEK